MARDSPLLPPLIAAVRSRIQAYTKATIGDVVREAQRDSLSPSSVSELVGNAVATCGPNGRVRVIVNGIIFFRERHVEADELLLGDRCGSSSRSIRFERRIRQAARFVARLRRHRAQP